MKKLLVAAAIAGAAVGGGMVANAAINPGGGNTLSACYDNGGNLKLIDDGGACPRGYAGPVTWNKQGVPGTPGANGTNGVSGYERVSNSSTIPANTLSGVGAMNATCPAGKKVLGGGGSLLTVSGGSISDTQVTMSYPSDDDTWTIQYEFVNTPRVELVVTTWATCAIA